MAHCHLACPLDGHKMRVPDVVRDKPKQKYDTLLYEETSQKVDLDV